MAFITGFDYDVFLSYSHVDNLGRDAWVSQFHEELEFALAKRIGRHGVAKIWRDKRIEGNHVFDETIKQAVGRSALFVALTSQGYLESHYCGHELAWFYQRASSDQVGVKIGDRSRIFNVLLAAIDRGRWPPEYGGTTGYAFHTSEDPDDLGEPTHSRLDEARYRTQLKAVADSLYKTLLAFTAEVGKPSVPAPAAVPAEDRPKIFVADVSDSLASTRKRLIADLERRGIAVESSVPPPFEGAAHGQRVTAISRSAALTVHLLDQIAGREIDGEPGWSYPQKQAALVRAEGRRQLIWVPSTLDLTAIEDRSYREFLDELENGERKGANYDFVRGSSTALVPQIVEQLQQLNVRHREPTSPRAVLVDTHHKDHRYALDIARLLLDYNIVPYVIPEEDDPNKNIDAFGISLGRVSSLAIVYGAVSEAWVRQRLGAAMQLSVIKNLGVKSFCVVLVPPEKNKERADFTIGPVPVQLVDNSRSETVTSSSFELLLQAVARESPN